MKQRSTTPVSVSTTRGLATKSIIVAAVILTAVALPMQLYSQPARADRFDDQIAALQSQQSQYDAKAASLASQANTLQNKKSIIENQQASIQAQINTSQAKYDKLQQEIKENEQKIVDNKDALGQTIANMYIDDSVTPLELLASSSNIADYIDKQEYRNTMQTNLVKKIDEINALKKQLEKQRSDVEKVLSDQKAQRNALATKIAEYNKLVAQTRNQQSAYESLSAKNQAEQSSLRAQQQAAIAAAMQQAGVGNVVAGDSGHGGYPANLANAPQDSIIDPWGLLNRECVSYVAWKVYQKNGYMPYGFGNANMWPGSAQAHNIGTGSSPRAGSAGVIYAGTWGHIVWVDSVNGDGTINISQYNYDYGSGSGLFSRAYNVSPSAYDVYIYF